MDFNPPDWIADDPVTVKKLVALGDALRWMHDRVLINVATDGTTPTPVDAQGEILWYLPVDPATYPGYVGHPGRWGVFTITFPAGLNTLRTVQLTPASGSNGALGFTVSAESENSVTVMAFDSGGDTLGSFAVWLSASGELDAGVVAPTGIEAEYGIPNVGPKSPLTDLLFDYFGKSVSYFHRSGSYVLNGSGTLVSDAEGLAQMVAYLPVDPATYPGYLGYPGYYGFYTVTLPAGMFASILNIEVQPASGSNGALQASVRAETAASFAVFVFDSGLSAVQGHALWLRVTGILNDGYIPNTDPTSFDIPNFTSATEITSARLQKYTDSTHWQLRRLPFAFDINGAAIHNASGIGKLEGSVSVDPTAYAGYAGFGAPYGELHIDFPAGVLDELLFVKVQPASGTNTWMVATVKAESPGGVSVFVWDCGGSAIASPFALWMRAIGKLAPGFIA